MKTQLTELIQEIEKHKTIIEQKGFTRISSDTLNFIEEYLPKLKAIAESEQTSPDEIDFETILSDYHVTLENNRRDESIKLAVERYVKIKLSHPSEQTKCKDIISDEEIEKVFGFADFGNKSKRDVIIEALKNVAQSWHIGHTSQQICMELGLIEERSYSLGLSDKGLEYLLSYSHPSEQTKEEKKSAFLKKAHDNKTNFELHKQLINESIKPLQEHLGKESIKHFYESGVVSGGLLLALMEYAEKYSNRKQIPSEQTNDRQELIEFLEINLDKLSEEIDDRQCGKYDAYANIHDFVLKLGEFSIPSEQSDAVECKHEHKRKPVVGWQGYDWCMDCKTHIKQIEQ